ncbi:MAG: endonuclease domain-containing protein [Chloroflexi bacterium]|nr:endonuclease domain-containing protein [Chloroflexota bacterium]
MPPPARQHRVKDQGGLVAVVDFAYPDLKLAIEADGYRWHTGRIRWEHDLARRNRLTALGWRVLHVTWSDIEQRSEELMARIAAAAVPLGGTRPSAAN